MSFCNMIKDISKRPIANITLTGEVIEVFEYDKDHYHWYSMANAIKQEKEIRGKGLERNTKLSLFLDDVIQNAKRI